MGLDETGFKVVQRPSLDLLGRGSAEKIGYIGLLTNNINRGGGPYLR